MADKQTPTGRTPGEPNIQNIPIRTKLGHRIRKAFTERKLRWQTVSTQ